MIYKRVAGLWIKRQKPQSKISNPKSVKETPITTAIKAILGVPSIAYGVS
jgi:hypothetical protein